MLIMNGITFEMIHDLFDLFANTRADPGFLDRGFNLLKGVQSDYMYLSIFPEFSKDSP